MSFTDVTFLILLPISIVIYYLIPCRFRYVWLLLCSFLFYISLDGSFTTLLISSILITWVCGNLLYNVEKKYLKKLIIFLGVSANLAILAVFKYAGFILSLTGSSKTLNILLPAGISFYTFQSLTYIFDCHRGDVKPEKNIFKYALFVSFFPLILSGPIERAKNLLPQLECKASFDPNRAKDGLKLMLFGYFMKMVIVARLSILTDGVFSDYINQSGVAILFAIFFYTLQIYCDFAGYSNIAVGMCKIMGIDIMRNFRQPYFASSVSDFWRRWHISLSTWFRDYLYIPLGGNRKGTVRKYINVMIVFILSGIWHGANITFVIWGFLNGIYQVIGELIKPIKSRMKLPRFLSCIVTFILISFTWVFFRASSLSEAVAWLSKVFLEMNPANLVDGTIFTLGLGHNNLFLVCFALIILVVADILCEKNNCDVSGLMTNTKPVIRWCVYYILIMLIIISCNLSTQEFIYQQF